MADINFATNARSRANLCREGIKHDQVLIVSTPIVDSILKNLDRAAALDLSDRDYAAVFGGRFGVITLHRQENVDDPERLPTIIAHTKSGAAATAILFFAHPRTLTRLNEFGLMERPRSNQHINLLPSAGYLEFVAVLQKAACCVTNSSGVQREACIIGGPADNYGRDALAGHS